MTDRPELAALLAAAQIAVASRLEKAQPASPTDALAGSAPDTSAAAEKPQRARRCAFCAASLVGRRRQRATARGGAGPRAPMRAGPYAPFGQQSASDERPRRRHRRA